MSSTCAISTHAIADIGHCFIFFTSIFIDFWLGKATSYCFAWRHGSPLRPSRCEELNENINTQNEFFFIRCGFCKGNQTSFPWIRRLLLGRKKLSVFGDYTVTWAKTPKTGITQPGNNVGWICWWPRRVAYSHVPQRPLTRVDWGRIVCDSNVGLFIGGFDCGRPVGSAWQSIPGHGFGAGRGSVLILTGRRSKATVRHLKDEEVPKIFSDFTVTGRHSHIALLPRRYSQYP